MGPLLEPLDQQPFIDGLGVGMIAVLAVGVIGLAWRLLAHRPAPVAGLAVAFATLVALGEQIDVPNQVWTGVLLCAAAGVLADFGLPALLVGGAAVPGAVVLSNSPLIDAPIGDPDMRAIAVLVVVPIGGALVAAFDRRWRHLAWSPGLLAATAGGVYATVPDTEFALVLLGVAFAHVVVGWPVKLAHLGGAGSLAAVGVLAWIVAGQGGAGRDGAVVGACTALGLLAVDPLVRLVGGHSPLRRRSEVVMTAVVVVTHVALVLWCSRVAGLRTGADDALVLAVLGWVAVAVAWAGLGARTRRPTSGQVAVGR